MINYCTAHAPERVPTLYYVDKDDGKTVGIELLVHVGSEPRGCVHAEILYAFKSKFPSCEILHVAESEAVNGIKVLFIVLRIERCRLDDVIAFFKGLKNVVEVNVRRPNVLGFVTPKAMFPLLLGGKGSRAFVFSGSMMHAMLVESSKYLTLDAHRVLISSLGYSLGMYIGEKYRERIRNVELAEVFSAICEVAMALGWCICRVKKVSESVIEMHIDFSGDGIGKLPLESAKLLIENFVRNAIVGLVEAVYGGELAVSALTKISGTTAIIVIRVNKGSDNGTDNKRQTPS